MSDAPPTNCIVKVQCFSLLAKNAIDKYESEKFESGGHNWKLVLYPNGNKSRNVIDHISLYLEMVDTASLGLDWEVYVVVRLFLLNQTMNKYFLVQDSKGKESRFHPFKLQCGFDKFISVKDLNRASNGYLVEDTCVFGADVLVKKGTGKGECLSLIKNAYSIKHVWRIENFSKLESKCLDSEVFADGERKWKIQLHPKGDSLASDGHLSMYLSSAEAIAPGTKILIIYTLRIMDQMQGRHQARKSSGAWFTASDGIWGWRNFVSLSDLNLAANGYLVNDLCLVEADVTVHGISSAL